MDDANALPLPAQAQGAGRLVAAVIALGAFALLCFSPQIYNDGDTGWHLAAGRYIIDHLAVPRQDPFSYTFAGAPWMAHEWLAEVIFASAAALGGWAMISVITAAALAILLLIMGREAARWLAPPRVALFLLLTITMLLPFLLARPHLLSWPLLAGWTTVLLHARERRRPPALAAAAIMVVWANLHGSFLFGLCLAGLFGLEAVIEDADRRAALIGWLRFGALALTASLMTPHGIDGLIFPLTVSRMTTLNLIYEWKATIFPSEATFGLPLLVLLLVILVQGVRLRPLRALLVAIVLTLAFLHIRHQQLVAIVGGLVLIGPIGRSFAAFKSSATPAWLGRSVALIAALAIGVRLALPAERPAAANNPAAAIAQIPADLRRQPVLNEYSFGGALIYAGIKPYIDGRADMYGDAFFLDATRILDGDRASFDRAVKRWHISWTILPPHSAVVARLDHDPTWRRQYTDRWAVIHVRRAIRPGG